MAAVGEIDGVAAAAGAVDHRVAVGIADDDRLSRHAVASHGESTVSAGASSMMSPGCGRCRVPSQRCRRRVLDRRPAIGAGTARVVTAPVRVSEPPSGSVSASSTS